MPEELRGPFDAKRWLSNPGNIALRIADDLMLFDDTGDGIYLAHVYFASRGKRALERARAMLGEMMGTYGARQIVGETPVTLPHALWFARACGFKPVRHMTRPKGTVVFSVLDNAAFGNCQRSNDRLERAVSAR